MTAEDPERQPTPEEEREAAALAASLDGATPVESPPAREALATAALVREGREGGLLADDRRDAVLDRVLAAETRARPRRVLRWVVPSLAVAAAAALAMVALRPGDKSTARATALPGPSASVLRAQLDVARGGDPSRLDEEMRVYRRDVYAALRRRYGGAR